jgi:hypothetical protein
VTRGGITDPADRVDRTQELLGNAGTARRLRSGVPETTAQRFRPHAANARHRIGQRAQIGAQIDDWQEKQDYATELGLASVFAAVVSTFATTTVCRLRPGIGRTYYRQRLLPRIQHPRRLYIDCRLSYISCRRRFVLVTGNWGRLFLS